MKSISKIKIENIELEFITEKSNENEETQQLIERLIHQKDGLLINAAEVVSKLDERIKWIDTNGEESSNSNRNFMVLINNSIKEVLERPFVTINDDEIVTKKDNEFANTLASTLNIVKSNVDQFLKNNRDSMGAKTETFLERLIKLLNY
jgi:hypothetical protein